MPDGAYFIHLPTPPPVPGVHPTSNSLTAEATATSTWIPSPLSIRALQALATHTLGWSPKIRGGGENFEFPGAPEIDPYRDSIENPQFGGQKSKSSGGNFRGEFPPPSSVRYVLTPPIPVSELFNRRKRFSCNGSLMAIIVGAHRAPKKWPKYRSGVRKRVVSKRVVLADVPPERKPERGYVRQNHPFGNRPFISQWPFLVLTKGWFPKGWFRRMFPRNESRNKGTFAKTTLLRNRPFISQWIGPGFA